MLKILDISDPDELQDKLLQARAKRARGGWVDRYLVAQVESAEAGVLVLDHYPTTDSAGIHEIFVLAPFRRQGVGTKLLQNAEARAQELGCRTIQLEVYPLDENINKEQLRGWYARYGYEQDESDPDKVRKALVKIHAQDAVVR